MVSQVFTRLKTLDSTYLASWQPRTSTWTTTRTLGSTYLDAPPEMTPATYEAEQKRILQELPLRVQEIVQNPPWEIFGGVRNIVWGYEVTLRHHDYPDSRVWLYLRGGAEVQPGWHLPDEGDRKTYGFAVEDGKIMPMTLSTDYDGLTERLPQYLAQLTPFLEEVPSMDDRDSRYSYHKARNGKNFVLRTASL